MRKYLISALLLTIVQVARSNDGAFFGKGNQLIPIKDSTISVTKEILTIKELGDDAEGMNYVEIDVYYEFFNSAEVKEVLVGFEAKSPSGDVNGWPVDGKHPYMHDFTVVMNGNKLPYVVAYYQKDFDSENFLPKGDYTLPSPKQMNLNGGNWVPFEYVYHFTGKFNKGKNIVRHKYRLAVSGGVCSAFELVYVLTAANRWANEQIDDFTLVLDLKNPRGIYIDQNFFKDTKNWSYSGTAITVPSCFYDDPTMNNDTLATLFPYSNKPIRFSAKNFKPAGELYMNRPMLHPGCCFRTSTIPFEVKSNPEIDIYKVYKYNYKASDYESYRILSNVPYAIRGYVFRNAALNAYFTKQKWYKADTTYKPSLEGLSEYEQNWLYFLAQENLIDRIRVEE